MNRVLQLFLFALVNLFFVNSYAQFNPTAQAKGFNIFAKTNVTFNNGETDGAIAMGADATLAGNVNIAVHGAGSYPNGAGNSSNYGLVVGGKFVFKSGNQSHLNAGYLRVGSTSGTMLFYKDCNNASTNLKVTPYNSDCNTAYNANPQLALQRQQPSPTATSASGLNFTTAFTAFQQNAAAMAKYVPSAPCASSFNFIAPVAGSQFRITLVSNKINVINLTGAQLNAITQITFNNHPTANTPLIFNINQPGNFTWASHNNAGLNNTDGAFIIYNFYNNTGTIKLVNANTVIGSVFAPGASFEKNHSGNIEGQIVCNNFTLNGGEVHEQIFTPTLPECELSLLDDIDDDNDGILDVVESGGYDPLKDCDNDGIPNYKDPTPGCPTPAGKDVYGKPYLPLTWTDCNSDGINDFFDFDRDGIINELDLDSDNDGILDINETRDPKVVDANNDGMVDGDDPDNDGLLSTADADNNNPSIAASIGLIPQDLDRDGTPNYLDLDSDGDGITDYTEATGIISSTGKTTGNDTDKDGVRSENFGSSGATVADNINGFGARGIKLPDSDKDGKPDPYDIDSDNDGITDNIEGQPTCSYKLPSGNDCDGDGVDDAYDVSCDICTRNSGRVTPYDKDGDGTPDYLDLDTDQDGAEDIHEGSGRYGNFVTKTADTDGDGLIDEFDIFNIKTATGNFIRNVVHSNMGVNGSFDGPSLAGSNASLPQHAVGSCANNTDRDWRNVALMPVTLTEFKGTLNNNVISLSWTTVDEINMSRYVVERSFDAQKYITIAEVKATGNSTTKLTYTHQDKVNDISSNTVYYRLKQVDISGEYKYSNILVFKIKNTAATTLSVYPNPAVNYFTVQLNALKDGMATIRLTDMLGRTLLTRSSQISLGTNNIMFNDLNNIAAGTYTLQLIIDGDVTNRKVIIYK